MSIKKILLLGDPALYQVSRPVERAETESLGPLLADLRDTLLDFRSRWGAGRAIAAPQIGDFRRVIYLDVPSPRLLINPSWEELSTERFELWDDCMSFPGIAVKVIRHRRCCLRFRDENGEKQILAADGAMAELLQHEYDHLDGILAFSRAVDDRSFALHEKGRFLSASPPMEL